METNSLNCPNCQSPLNVKPGESSVKCEYCGSTVAIDDGSVKVDINIPDQEDAGYKFEKGRQRAQAEQLSAQMQMADAPAEPERKRKTWLWVLGWIFIFPVPLTILMLNSSRTKGLDKKVRVGIVIAAWVVYFAIGLCGGGGSGSNHNATNSANTENSAIIEQGSNSNKNKNSNNVSDPTATSSIVIDGVNDGEYGKKETINGGTDSSKTFVAYYVPAGTYTVKNNGSKAQQVSVYKDGTQRQGNYDEQIASSQSPVLVKAGDTAEITVNDSEYVSLGSVPSTAAKIELTRK